MVKTEEYYMEIKSLYRGCKLKKQKLIDLLNSCFDFIINQNNNDINILINNPSKIKKEHLISLLLECIQYISKVYYNEHKNVLIDDIGFTKSELGQLGFMTINGVLVYMRTGLL